MTKSYLQAKRTYFQEIVAITHTEFHANMSNFQIWLLLFYFVSLTAKSFMFFSSKTVEHQISKGSRRLHKWFESIFNSKNIVWRNNKNINKQVHTISMKVYDLQHLKKKGVMF